MKKRRKMKMKKKFKTYEFDYARKAKSVSYGALRNKKNIKGIVIHYTSGSKDTAKNECDYFATGNTRSAGAHIFIDYEGKSGRSIPLTRTAWSVGNPGGCYQRGTYYSTLNNSNTVSIELCGIANRFASEVQIEETEEVIRWIKRSCPNVQYIVRHYDIVRKNCPAPYVENEKAWRQLQKRLLKCIK